MSDDIVVREVTDPRDPAIEGFGEMQSAAYFAPEALIPASYIPGLLGDPEKITPNRRNYLVVAEQDGRVIGGSLFHWLADAGTGFSSFLGVERQARGKGIARRLHEKRLEILDRAAGGRLATGVFIDVVSPTRLRPEDLEREKRVGSDPWDRRSVFAHLGFRQVDIRYEQPVGGPNGGPVTTLDLLYFPRDPIEPIPTELVVATMQAYWTPWLGVERARYFALQLGARAGGKQMLALIPPDAEPRPERER